MPVEPNSNYKRYSRPVALSSMSDTTIDQVQPPQRAWGTREAMALCGYRDRDSFHNMCATRGAPVSRVNARTFRYDPIEFQAWWRGLAA